MGLFGALIKVALTPVAVLKDVISIAGAIDNNGKSHTIENLEEAIKIADR